MRKKITERQPRSAGIGIGAGFGIALIISVIGAAIATSMLINETVKPTSINFLARIVQFISTAVGGVAACVMTKGKFALSAGITSAAYCFLLVAVSVLLFDSAFTSFWTSLLSVGLGYITSCALCIMRSGKKQNRKHTHR